MSADMLGKGVSESIVDFVDGTDCCVDVSTGGEDCDSVDCD